MPDIATTAPEIVLDDDTSTPRQRRAWLEAWASANCDQTVDAARNAMRGKFGRALNPNLVGVILREARRRQAQMADGGPIRPHLTLASALGRPQLEATPLQELIRMVRATGVRRIEVQPNGSILIEVQEV